MVKQPMYTKKNFPPRDKVNFIVRLAINSEAAVWVNDRVSNRWAEIKDLRNNVVEATDIFDKSWIDQSCNKCYGRGLDGNMVNPDGSRTIIVCECVLKYVVKNLKDIKKAL